MCRCMFVCVFDYSVCVCVRVENVFVLMGLFVCLFVCLCRRMQFQGVKSFHQREPLTRRLKNILQEYAFGGAIVKELLQNADDAKASDFKLLLDLRPRHRFGSGGSDAEGQIAIQELSKGCEGYSSPSPRPSTSSPPLPSSTSPSASPLSLISPEMSQWQGPALYAFNDSEFTENDFENLSNIGGAGKADDSTRTGRFGLGFNVVSSYKQQTSCYFANTVTVCTHNV